MYLDNCESTSIYSIIFLKLTQVVNLGPVVQSMVSLTSSLRGQLLKYFTTLLLHTLTFFVEKMKEAFAMQKLFTFFQQKINGVFEILTFEILTKR